MTITSGHRSFKVTAKIISWPEDASGIRRETLPLTKRKSRCIVFNCLLLISVKVFFFFFYQVGFCIFIWRCSCSSEISCSLKLPLCSNMFLTANQQCITTSADSSIYFGSESSGSRLMQRPTVSSVYPGLFIILCFSQVPYKWPSCSWYNRELPTSPVGTTKMVGSRPGFSWDQGVQSAAFLSVWCPRWRK